MGPAPRRPGRFPVSPARSPKDIDRLSPTAPSADCDRAIPSAPAETLRRAVQSASMRGKSTRPVSFSTMTGHPLGSPPPESALLDGALAEDRRFFRALCFLIVVFERAKQRIIRIGSESAAVGAVIHRAEARNEYIVLEIQLRDARRRSPPREPPEAACGEPHARHRAP